MRLQVMSDICYKYNVLHIRTLKNRDLIKAFIMMMLNCEIAILNNEYNKNEVHEWCLLKIQCFTYSYT